MMHVCFDIGGSSIKMCVINEKNEFLEKRSEVVVDHMDAIYKILVDYTNEMKEKYEIEGIGISAPGAVNTKTGIIGGASALVSIHGPNFKADLLEKTGLQVGIENDANCAALAEIYYGAAKENKDVCTMVIGSGVGGTIVKDKKVHHGANLHGGEFGYLFVATQNGVETLSNVAATGALVRNANKIEGLELSGEEVFLRAQNDDRYAKVVHDFYYYLALGAINVQYTFDPEVILFGGAISKREDFIANIEAGMDSLLNVEGSIHKIRPVCKVCEFGNDANLLGAKVNFIQST